MNNTSTRDKSKIIYSMFLVFSGMLVIASLLIALSDGGLVNMLRGYAKIVGSTAFLALDTCNIGGCSAAFLNAGIVGFCVLFVFLLAKVKANGYTMVSFFLSISLSFVSLSILGFIFIVPGVWLFSYARGESFNHYANNAVLASALEPVVSLILFSTIPIYIAIPLSIIAGTALGFVFQPVFTRTQLMHRGHSLYNTGLAAGFITCIVSALLRSTTHILLDTTELGEKLSQVIAASEYEIIFICFFGLLFVVCLIFGLKLSDWSLKPYFKLLRHSGHGFDFTYSDGMGSVLINMALMGIATVGYFLLIGIPISGLAACALIGIVGLSGSGAHIRNTIPIILGYGFIAQITGTSLASSIYVLSLPCAVALSPVSGRFGWITGLTAGAMHALLTPYTSTLSGGLNLCAGGISSGITAMLITGLLESLHPSFMDRYKQEQIEEQISSIKNTDKEKSAKDAPHNGGAIMIIRNVFAIIAGALFILSLFRSDRYTALLRAAAYITGALAYGAEILILTDKFKKKQSPREMLMPYLFGLLYIMLGISYIVGH